MKRVPPPRPTPLLSTSRRRLPAHSRHSLTLCGCGCSQQSVPIHVESHVSAISLSLPTFPSPPSDRKSTRLNSSHVSISYAVFCLKKKKKKRHIRTSNSKTARNRNS